MFTLRIPGFVPNASTGEFAHQQHKKSNKSSSGRNVPKHYIVSANTTYGWQGLKDGVRYNVMRYDARTRKRCEVTVRAGLACSRVLRTLEEEELTGKLSASDDVAEAGTPSRARLAGSHKGSALWNATMKKDSDENVMASAENPEWDNVVATGPFRPTAKAVEAAYKKHFGCGKGVGVDAPPCEEPRCPQCWLDTGTLVETTMRCSRFNHFAFRVASSGTGRWKGGDARKAAATTNWEGLLDDRWVFGADGGENVEVWKTTPPTGDAESSANVDDLSMGKIVYFFKHRGNTRVGSTGPGPETWWVLVFEYVSAGAGKSRLPDVATRHPIMRLRGRGVPTVFPADNIRRHVHLYHVCPCLGSGNVEGQEADERWVCGVAQDGSRSGTLVWRHAFKLSRRRGPKQRMIGEDRYLLNEHHHSIYQDSFIS